MICCQIEKNCLFYLCISVSMLSIDSHKCKNYVYVKLSSTHPLCDSLSFIPFFPLYPPVFLPFLINQKSHLMLLFKSSLFIVFVHVYCCKSMKIHSSKRSEVSLTVAILRWLLQILLFYSYLI